MQACIAPCGGTESGLFEEGPLEIDYPPAPIPSVLLGGSINLLAGAPNVGKTAFLAGFLKRIRDGALVFGRQPSPLPKIAILSVDRSWHQSSKLWYDLSGWPDIPHYCLQDDMAFPVEQLRLKWKRIEVLKAALKALEPLPFGSLVVIDPIAPFLGGNLLDYDACMVACTQIRRLCRERGITVIGVAHASKQKNDKKEQYRRLQDRIIGSTAQFGYTDTQMYLASPEETGEKYYSFLWHPHHTPAETFKLARGENGLFVPFGQLATTDGNSRRLDDATDTEKSIWHHLPTAQDGIGVAVLTTLCGHSKATVFRALQKGLEQGVVIKCGHGIYRRPPSH